MKKIVLLLICLFFTVVGACTSSTPTSNQSNPEKTYSAQRHIDLGKKYMNERNFSVAKASFIEAAKLDPENVEAYGLAGTAAKHNRDYREAIMHFNKVIELEPNEYRAYGNIGSISKRIKDYDTAIKAFKKVLEINPDDFRASDSLAEIYYKLKDYNNCQLYLNKFDEAIVKIKPALLSERTKRGIEKAKERHFNYRKAITN